MIYFLYIWSVKPLLKKVFSFFVYCILWCLQENILVLIIFQTFPAKRTGPSMHDLRDVSYLDDWETSDLALGCLFDSLRIPNPLDWSHNGVWVISGLVCLYTSYLILKQIHKIQFLKTFFVNSKTQIKAGSANGKTTFNQVIKKEDKSKQDDDKYDKLLKSAKLKDAGILTDEEFNKEKKKILNDE